MLKVHKDILEEFREVGKKAKVILFGSVSKGNYRTDSDMDIAIITDDKSVIKKSGEIADEMLWKYGKLPRDNTMSDLFCRFSSPNSLGHISNLNVKF